MSQRSSDEFFEDFIECRMKTDCQKIEQSRNESRNVHRYIQSVNEGYVTRILPKSTSFYGYTLMRYINLNVQFLSVSWMSPLQLTRLWKLMLTTWVQLTQRVNILIWIPIPRLIMHTYQEKQPLSFDAQNEVHFVFRRVYLLHWQLCSPYWSLMTIFQVWL